jgi:phytoene dehydrogenase-like protein
MNTKKGGLLMSNYNSIIIGSGINSLVAGAILAKNGNKPLLLERNDWIGGCLKTRELTLPGFIHDELAGWHPLFITSPAYAELEGDLKRHGLEYLNTEVPTGVILPNGESTVLYNNREKNIELFNKLCPGDGDAFDELMSEFNQNANLVFTMLSNNVQSWTVIKEVISLYRKKGMKNFRYDIGSMLDTARGLLDSRMTSDKAKAVLVPWILHTGLGPDDTASSIMLQVLAFSLEQAGMPVPKGGAVSLVKALSSIIEENGGEILSNKPVDKILVNNKTVQGVQVGEEQYY